eukprot:TRINITY_DN71494_c0_g1_i1.p1 TRINITY_DN71494_c0_g1~~TRINITY_DN71494_c0_g1_i1.p1  ORF type:complete len:239 (+),score=37.97 TRINITY_DN71494_c0_g1_i1:23-718(+)
MRSALAILAVALGVVAQDPAPGWLGYAKATGPANSVLTYIEAKWKVGQNPRRTGAFFSPWFGIETSDNLNLIQPVNPWVENHWEIYNEYFQWVPEHNENSASHVVKPGDVLFGSVTFDQNKQAYTMVHSDLTTGWNVTTTIPVQRTLSGAYKKYTIAYFVFEKEAPCDCYPPDGSVTFYDIKIQYDGQTVSPTWTTGIVDDVCNNRAHIIDPATIQITWTTAAEASKAPAH